MVILRHLWTLPTHRPAFQGIAMGTVGGAKRTSDSEATQGQGEDTDNYFVRFANGLMNETNSLVATTMEKLG